MPVATVPAVPKSYAKPYKTEFWGHICTVRPAVATVHLGDGKVLLWFTPANTRPNYYLIRVGSEWARKGHDGHEYIESVIDALAGEFSELEVEREYLEEDLKAEGIKPDGDNTDLDGNEDRLGWPVLSLDSGYSWGVEATWDGARWVKRP